MLKADLRKQYLIRRRALSADEVTQQSQQITTRLLALLSTLPVDKLSILHTFLPIQRHNEVDTWLIVHQLWDQYPHIQLAVPVTDMAQSTMRHYVITPATIFVANRLGIPEPLTNGSQIQPDELSIVLVPMLVFDQKGQRVGYGGGFYDRFLAQCQPDCLKIGLSLFEPIDQISDGAETDIPLDGCITPDAYWRFSL
jgi:5-formyltetrahydrofolate cyclo-ligase